MFKTFLLLIYNKYRFITNTLRTLFFRNVCASFGVKSKILGRVKTYSIQNMSIGSNTTVNDGCVLNARSKLTIGNSVHISPGVIINTGGLDYSKVSEERPHIKKDVVICDGVWLGSGAIVNPGVTIGDNSVVGAGAVVTKNIPQNCVAVGVPAKVIKSI